MTDQMNDNYLLGVKNLVRNAVIANSELVEPRQVTAESIWFHGLGVCCQPTNALHNATRDLSVKLRELASSGVLDADLVHG
jgi:hypothetical protein